MRFSRSVAHALAAEYVVGTLQGRARRRFELLARDDRELAAIVRRWEDELNPLGERVKPIEPPARVWAAIEARIAPQRRGAADTEASSAEGFWSSLPFWRSLGMIAAGLASVLVAAVLWLSPERPADAEPAFVAVLTSSDSVARMVVSLHAPGELQIRMVKPWAGIEGKSLELWVLPKNGAPRSLGLIDERGDTRIRLAAGDARFQGANALAVSMEPRGGSPSGQPTGPVLCSGTIAATRRT